jgi:hypothetical protein
MFTPKQIKLWRRTTFREISRLGFKPERREFWAGMVMATVYSFGTDVATLCALTGYSDEFVRATLKRLRKTRVLVGQTMRVAWDDPGFTGQVALVCDVLTAGGVVNRPADPKRSAAQKARTASGKPRAPRRASPKPSGPFTPKVVKSNPLYEIAEEK